MAHITLYRKYRPATFTDIIGQDHVVKTLLTAIITDRISHAYLFCGPRGTGKTTTARLIAQALNCQKLSPDGHPCQQCNFCQQLKNHQMIDLLEIDAASNRGIDEIRELRKTITLTPSIAKYKVYIIDEVHMLTKEAFNALLKTLEEPPAHAYFILATTEAHKIPATIISRCQRFDFHRVAIPDIVKYLQYVAKQEKISIDHESLELIAKLADGGMRDAVSLLEQLSSSEKITLNTVQQVCGVASESLVHEFIDSLLADKQSRCLELVQEFYQSGADLTFITRSILINLRTQLLQTCKDHKSPDRLITLIHHFTDVLANMKNTPIPTLPLEIAIIQTTHIAESQPLSAPTPPPVKITAALSTPPSVSSDHAPKPTIIKNISGNKIGIADIKQHWSSILNDITQPAVKISLSQTKLSNLGASGSLAFTCNSHFHIEKIMQPVNKAHIESVITKHLGTNIQINCQYDPDVTGEPVEKFTPPVQTSEAPQGDLSAQTSSSSATAVQSAPTDLNTNIVEKIFESHIENI